jgi:hypothetical protein
MDNPNKDIKDWKDYWNRFDNLCEIFDQSNRQQIKEEFIEARQYVNGMTDGWFEFVIRLEKALKKHKSSLDSNELEISNFLLNYIKTPLSKY